MRPSFPTRAREFRRRDRGFDTHTEIAVSPEDDIELRRITITNTTRSRKTIEVTSYAEVVLASAAADALHPAFSNLFVQTEILRAQQAILCTRRPRSREEHPPWLCHLMAVHGGGRRARPPMKPTACASSAAATRWPIRRRWPSDGAALQQRWRGARSDRGHSPADRARWRRVGHGGYRHGHRRRRARPVSGWWRSIATGTWRTASSSWPGRTARCCCARSTPPRPTRNSTGSWPAP